MKHKETHPDYVEGCWGCHAASIQFGSTSPVVAAQSAADRQLAKDRDAYKRLRNDGLQPKSLDGSSTLESTVNSQFDIDLGRVIPKEERSRVEEGMAMVREGGLIA